MQTKWSQAIRLLVIIVLAVAAVPAWANIAPSADDLEQTIGWCPEIRCTLYGRDPDYGPGPLVRKILSLPSNGTLKVRNASYQWVPATAGCTTDLFWAHYYPEAAYTGTVTFTWALNDGLDDSNEATHTINITEPTAPEVFNTRSVMVENEAYAFRPRFWDDDENNAHTFTLVSAPAHGILKAAT